MKKNFYLLLIVFTNFSFAQTYHFDHLIKYLSVNKTTGFQDSGIVLINSKDNSYHGDLYALSKDDNTSFIIRDKKGEVMHDFEIPRKSSPNLASNYKYKNSGYYFSNERNDKVQKDAHFEEIFLSKEESGKKILLKKFKNSKSKNPEIIVTADYVDFDMDLRRFNFEHLFSVNAGNVTLPQVDQSYIKHAEWNINKVNGEYNSEVFKFDLTLEIKPIELKLPKEKPVQKPFNLEEMKNSILEQRARN